MTFGKYTTNVRHTIFSVQLNKNPEAVVEKKNRAGEKRVACDQPATLRLGSEEGHGEMETKTGKAGGGDGGKARAGKLKVWWGGD